MTSNIGTRFAMRSGTLGFPRRGEDQEDQREQELRREISGELKKTFRPEFLNRVDEVIIFHNLTPEHMLQIVDLQMKEVGERLREQGVEIALTGAARAWLAEKGYDRELGARPLRRSLQRYIENPLALKLLGGELEAGGVLADVQDDEIVFHQVETPSVAAQDSSLDVDPDTPDGGPSTPAAGPDTPQADAESEPAESEQALLAAKAAND